MYTFIKPFYLKQSPSHPSCKRTYVEAKSGIYLKKLSTKGKNQILFKYNADNLN